MSKLKIWQASIEEEDGEWDVYLTHNRSNDYWKIKIMLPKPIFISALKEEVRLIFNNKTTKDMLGKLYINGKQWPYREGK